MAEPMDFVAWLQAQRKGALLDELGQKMAELTQAVVEHDKPGTLTIKIGVKSAAHGELGTVIVGDDVILKAPTPDRSASVFFVTAEFDLSRRNPSQMTLAEGQVPAIGEAEGEIPNDPKD